MTDPEKHGFYSVDNIFDKDNEFAGRLRHELCHTFYQLTGGKDKLHILEQDNISLVLKDIKWKNLSTQS